MNKTLEDIKTELRDKYAYDLADDVVELIWNAALDACREKIEEQMEDEPENIEHPHYEQFQRDWDLQNEVRLEALSTIDSLRPVEGKDV